MFLLYKFTRNYFLFSYTSDFDRRRLECCHVLRYQIVGRDQQSMGRHCNHLLLETVSFLTHNQVIFLRYLWLTVLRLFVHGSFLNVIVC